MEYIRILGVRFEDGWAGFHLTNENGFAIAAVAAAVLVVMMLAKSRTS